MEVVGVEGAEVARAEAEVAGAEVAEVARAEAEVAGAEVAEAARAEAEVAEAARAEAEVAARAEAEGTYFYTRPSERTVSPERIRCLPHTPRERPPRRACRTSDPEGGSVDEESSRRRDRLPTRCTG